MLVIVVVLIEYFENRLYVSVVLIWEIVIKYCIGNLFVYLRDVCLVFWFVGFVELLISSDYVEGVVVLFDFFDYVDLFDCMMVV